MKQIRNLLPLRKERENGKNHIHFNFMGTVEFLLHP
jgi:hypothetical protein